MLALPMLIQKLLLYCTRIVPEKTVQFYQKAFSKTNQFIWNYQNVCFVRSHTCDCSFISWFRLVIFYWIFKLCIALSIGHNSAVHALTPGLMNFTYIYFSIHDSQHFDTIIRNTTKTQVPLLFLLLTLLLLLLQLVVVTPVILVLLN